MFDISPTEEAADFEVKAKFMGVEMEKVQLHFQVNISLETLLHRVVVVARFVICAWKHDILSCWKSKMRKLNSKG